MNSCIQYYCRIFTENRITRDYYRRISVNCNQSIFFWILSSTYCKIINSNFYSVIDRIVINCSRIERIDAVSSICNSNTIYYPLIRTSAKQFVVSSVDCCDSNLCTITNIGLINEQFGSFNFRSGVKNINCSVTACSTTTVHLSNCNIILSCVSYNSCQFSACSCWDSHRVCHTISFVVPLIYQIRHIVITEMSSQGNLIVLTNCCCT